VNFQTIKTNLQWLKDRTIFLTKHGSHAYGTSIPTSDEDFRGITIPPIQYFMGYLEQFEHVEFYRQQHGVDMVIYDIRKFFKLAADCNPNIIEILYTDPSDHLLITGVGEKLLTYRDQFLSRKAKYTFSGYAVSQLKKIERHYQWLRHPPKAAPTREEFGLPQHTVIPADQLIAVQEMIRKQIEHWNVPVDELDSAAKIAVQERFVETLAFIETGYRAQVVAALQTKVEEFNTKPEHKGLIHALSVVKEIGGIDLEQIAGTLLGFSDDFLELLDRERTYKSRQEEWRSYQVWINNRNPVRFELERKYGYDTKHGMHLVRLIRMGREILEGKGVLVRRPDAQELLAIRGGAWTYEYLCEWAQKSLNELEYIDRTSILPSTPNRIQLDKLCTDLVQELIPLK